ncbi:M48 family metallopeptidase [Helicobacter cappadocius]|uniref:M48 family metallopeptidase n=1 Tax=Helicobacter cappadocius TaxID=3063998 RepID=A0AA90TES4_9HELI|nr:MULTISPECIES: M48 family metallopeptidase [unclassified Helicobacter]MDO7252867.1 M48 family metallopeptidase [Helicobacter sp. faydin-H75]MDP2538910.1 M48 family metallopeptidase [Helicobacter sp. faydin-H76]
MLYFLGFIYIFFYTIPNIILNYLQSKHIKLSLARETVILSPNDWKDAAEYSLEKLRISNISSVIDALMFLLWIGVGLYWLEDASSSWGQSQNIVYLIYVMAFLLVGFIVSLPLGYYTQMVLDKKYGFNKSSFSLYLKDLLKSFVMLMLFGGIIVFFIIEIMQNFSYWWLYGFFLIFAIAILANVLYPTLIAPIFNKFTPLNDDVLSKKIESMMVKVGFKSSGIFVMDASKRDGRLNAYFGGLGRSKRVVLFDTLLQKVSQDGLLAILGHELGHFKHKDILKNITIMGILLFVLFFIAGNIPIYIFDNSNIVPNPGIKIVFLLLIAPIISFWAMPIIGYFSRRAEYGADEYGAMLTSKRCLAEALIRLVNENKSFPCSHPAYIFFYYTHPPLLERLKALDYHMEK